MWTDASLAFKMVPSEELVRCGLQLGCLDYTWAGMEYAPVGSKES